MKKEGIIKIENHKLVILDQDALCKIIDTNTIKTCTNCLADFKKEIGYKE
jgi:CRP/FNR family transcriptional regulator